MSVICKYCTILYKALEHPWILIYMGGPGTNPLWIWKNNCITTHIIVDESHKHTEQKKQIAEYMLYNSIYVKFQNMINCAICCLCIDGHVVKG